MKILHGTGQCVHDLEQVLLLHKIDRITDDHITHRALSEMQRQEQKILSRLRIVKCGEDSVHFLSVQIQPLVSLIGKGHLHLPRITVYIKAFVRRFCIQVNALFRLFFICIQMIIQYKIHRIAFQGRNALRDTIHHLLHRIALHHFRFHGEYFLIEFFALHTVHDLILQMCSGIPAAALSTAATLLPQHFRLSEIVFGYILPCPEPQEYIHPMVSSFFPDMSHSCNAGCVKASLVKIIKSGDTKIVRCMKSHLCRGFTYRNRHIVINTDHSIRELLVPVP